MSTAPWDVLQMYNAPSEKTFSLGSSATLVAPADPQRVLIIFGPPGGGGSLTVSTNPNVTSSTGFGLANVQLPWTLSYGQYGSLVAAAWYALSNALGNITVLTLSMRDWPRSGVVQYADSAAIQSAIRYLSRNNRHVVDPGQS